MDSWLEKLQNALESRGEFVMDSWAKMLQAALASHGETIADIAACTLTGEEILAEFDSGHGSIEGKPFTVWTRRRVYFPVAYDGAEWVGSVARHPDGKPTEHQGGG